MLSIDEAIANERDAADIARGNIINSNNLDGYESWNNSQCVKCAEEHEQLAEWLEELKAYRENSNGYNKEDIELNRNAMYNKAIDDFANILKENYDYLPQILSQEAFDRYIDEYGEQLKEGVNINEQS